MEEMKKRPQVVLPGHFVCAIPVAFRAAISAIVNPIVVIPACCATVVNGTAPWVVYNVPVLNIAFVAHATAAS